jgi:asparagine synthase (glutamine-hydrolysing)
MANSLECRSPFLDAEVVNIARAMPESLKLRGGTGKYIVRRAFGNLLPPVTIKRSKQGFVVPIRDWLRDDFRPLMEEVLFDARALSRGFFRPEAIRRLVHEHVEGTVDHSRRLWALLWFELWHRTFIDSARPELVTL